VSDRGKTRFLDRPAVRNFVGRYILGGYVHLGMATSKVTYHPADFRERSVAANPAIYVVWHANMVAIGYAVPDHKTIRVLVSPHPDGRMGAAAIATWGGKVIYGTGATFKQSEGTRGLAGTREMLRELEEGNSILMTADVPPIPGRKVSRGPIRLARLSGRPIIPMAVGSSNRTILERVWDKTQLNHPFSKVAVVGGAPMHVDDSLDDDEAAKQLKLALDDCYDRALKLTAR
jgi:lysophospholipid acyltransferase (LPLAT)-like uncharacterized protein